MLIKINEAAKKMAKLDFDNYIEVDGQDEIAELSTSLNYMSKNLKETLEELERVNLKLTEDIERERNIEKERREFIELLQLTEKDIIVEGDSNLIKKAFTNIIKNAITHTPRGEHIIIKEELHKITVENTGVIIEKNQLAKVFDAFYRVDKSRNRKTGGTGLGLYIVKTIFDKHGNIKYKMNSKENSVEFVVEF